jgi:hypothetical protein
MANVIIDIAAEFTGNKAFKKAESSTEKLTKNVKKLAAATGLVGGPRIHRKIQRALASIDL